MVHFDLVCLLVGVVLLVEGIVGLIFLVQFELQILVEVEQGLIEVQSQVGIDVHVDEGCFGFLIGEIYKVEVEVQKV